MFWNNLVAICNQHKTTPTAVVGELGIAVGSVTRWKNGSVPRDTTLKKLADYFDVTVDYLLGNTDNRHTMVGVRAHHELFAGTSPVEDKKNDPKPNAIFLDASHVFMIPTFENVSAGFGALANDEIVDYIPLYFAHPSEAEETICIKVKGDSMYPKIEEGDVIQVHKQDTVDSGTIAVVLLDGEEGLVKRVEYGDGWLELHSINPMYKTIRFTGSDVMRIRILGAVRKIIKNV